MCHVPSTTVSEAEKMRIENPKPKGQNGWYDQNPNSCECFDNICRGCSLNIWSKKKRNISQIFKVGIEETQVDEINLR
jgi:hypothetical protein